MKSKISIFAIIIFCFASFNNLLSNNLRLSNFNLHATDVDGLMIINIDTISWDNSWRVDIPGSGYGIPHNHDAIWFFAKYKTANSDTWKPAKFHPNSGFHQHSFDSEVKAVSDSMGLFVFRNSNVEGTNTFQHFEFAFNGREIYQNLEDLQFRIFAVEMVYIPVDDFWAGDGTTIDITGQFQGSDISPYHIVSEAQITLGGLSANSLNNRNALGMASPDDFNNTTTKILPAEFPKGFNSVYCMKYEVTSQQYVDFLNSLDTGQASERFANAFGTERNAIQKIGTKYFTTAPDRANNFMSWADGAAYTDWCGLRPMTELEMEKIARGPVIPVANEYAWGNTTIVQAESIEGTDGSGTETTLPLNSNCNYNIFDGGTGQPIGGPVRVGIFANATSDRTTSGSSYYGVMEMTGNVWERPVTVGNPAGRSFNALHGNGLVDAEGNADVLNWPGIDAVGSSFRMGNWFRSTQRARISDRYYGATPLIDRTGHRGFRSVRTPN
ncbi:MAG: SUMF1/EgtB/PvdO family nonheme iron enzyme [Ignavibacteria bacterium]